jgi:hypothetical protein
MLLGLVVSLEILFAGVAVGKDVISAWAGFTVGLGQQAESRPSTVFRFIIFFHFLLEILEIRINF